MSDVLTHTDTAKLYGSAEALPVIMTNTGQFRCVIALQGAQILEFSSKGQDFLWLSPNAKFEAGKPVRGGIPICAPWFGVHPEDPGKIKHGFVRNALWTLEGAELDEENERAAVRLSFAHQADDLFAHGFRMDYVITLSERLTLEMTITNTGAEAMPFSWAFHSYHPVSSLAAARVAGLGGGRYLDATDGFKPKMQAGMIDFPGEVDRVYEDVPETQTLIPSPSLSISAENCPSCIVWNPGAELAKGMADVGEEAYRGFVCVERGAVRNNALSIAGGESVTARLVIGAG